MFNQQELMALLKICDMATRSGGLEIAEFALPISHKVRRLLQQGQQGLSMQGNGAGVESALGDRPS